MVDLLLGEGYSCYRFDLRGHGRSEGRRGHIYGFDEYVDDFEAMRAHARLSIPEGCPLFVVSHSYGGLVSLHAVSRRPTGVDGLVMSSPFFGFKIRVPAWKAFTGRLLSRYVPALSLATNLDPKTVSHDPRTIEEYATDPLIGRVATTRWLTETEQAQASAPEAASRVEVPVLLQMAGGDQIVSPEAARAIFERVSSDDKTWQEYPDFFHEIWFEIDREAPLTALCRWLSAQLEALA
jgi:alpha-beta hydrolase superfamily lysophospholipase